jgi:hypothetical protein
MFGRLSSYNSCASARIACRQLAIIARTTGRIQLSRAHSTVVFGGHLCQCRSLVPIPRRPTSVLVFAAQISFVIDTSLCARAHAHTYYAFLRKLHFKFIDLQTQSIRAEMCSKFTTKLLKSVIRSQTKWTKMTNNQSATRALATTHDSFRVTVVNIECLRTVCECRLKI